MFKDLFAKLYLELMTVLIFCLISSLRKCFGGGDGATLILSRKLCVREIFLSKFFRAEAALGDSTWKQKSALLLIKDTGVKGAWQPWVRLWRTISLSNLAAFVRVTLCQP